jgi:hypothetical protein
MKLDRLIQMCLNGTYSNFSVGTPLSDTFPTQSVLKQGDGLSPGLFIFVLCCEFRKVQGKQQRYKVIWTHHLVVYTNNDHLLTENVV